MLVALGAWILHVGAMAFAPLSLVQAVISGGLVFLAVLADRTSASRSAPPVDRRRAHAVGLVAARRDLPTGGAALGLLGRRDDRLRGRAAPSACLLVLSPKLGASHEHHGVLLGAPAGILFGVSDAAIEALTGAVGNAGLLGSRLALARSPAWLASAIAFYASARALQQGEAVPVIAVTSAAANVSAIAGGIVVFGDPMPGDPSASRLSLAFVLVIGAATLTPAPLRAAEAR